VAFKRKQAAGVPMNGSSNGNGHAPTSQHSSPVIPAADAATFIEFWARCEVALDLILDTLNRQFPAADVGQKLEASQKLLTTFVIEWKRETGCQMPSIVMGGMKAYDAPAEAGAGEEIPF
jgi:hypothetical protein